MGDTLNRQLTMFLGSEMLLGYCTCWVSLKVMNQSLVLYGFTKKVILRPISCSSWGSGKKAFWVFLSTPGGRRKNMLTNDMKGLKFFVCEASPKFPSWICGKKILAKHLGKAENDENRDLTFAPSLVRLRM